jgi:uncharacterized protein DUF1963
MIHERLDIAHWSSYFSLERLREEARGQPAHMQPNACIISGPYDIAVLEQLRAEAYVNEPGITRIPTDVFVWSRGEPENRAVTKIGGLPYWPAGKPWPVAPSGRPMAFVAQFCFADSRDIVPPLPGDLLLVFAQVEEWQRGKYDIAWGTDDTLAFEWASFGDAPLVTMDEVPRTDWHLLSTYGAIYRTWDYPSVDQFAYGEIAEDIPGVWEATKIGGVDPWTDDENLDRLHISGESAPGTYICTLGSVMPQIHKPYPLLNHPEPIDYLEWRREGALMIGDVGLVNFYLDGSGKVYWRGYSQP